MFISYFILIKFRCTWGSSNNLPVQPFLWWVVVGLGDFLVMWVLFFFFWVVGFVLNFSLNRNLLPHLMFAKVIFTWSALMGLRFKPSNVKSLTRSFIYQAAKFEESFMEFATPTYVLQLKE